MGDNFQARTMKRKNVKGLALSAPAPKATAPADADGHAPGSIGNNKSQRADTLEIGVEFRPDWRTEDLEVIKDLGAGNGGTVSKVRHTGWNVIMARKIIHVEAKKEVRKRIVRELQIMHECNSPYIVNFYGAFVNESGDVTMCMEYMDCGSMDSVSKNFGPVRVDILGKIAEAVLGGLKYLYLAHRIMHRDIKPPNVLLNSRGQIKLCDFGVSSELENSVADTFVGTGTYMAPERIQGSPYTVKSDVWSVGLTLMELAVGKFPFSVENDDEDPDEAGPQGILDLLQQIVLEPSPKLPKSDAFPQILEDVIAKCLMKDPKDRPTPQELYDTDPFLQAAKRTPVDLEQWAVSMMEKHNRKSHLAPQLSPGTKALLRGDQETPRTATTRGPGPIGLGGQATPKTGPIGLGGMAAPKNGPIGLGGMATPKTATISRPPMTEAGEIPIASPAGAQNGRSAGPRPGYPARTSSAQNNAPGYMPQPQYPPQYPQQQQQQQQQQMNLPIRQAPGNRRAVIDARVDNSGSERSDESYSRSERSDESYGRSERSDGSYSRRAPKLGNGYVQ